ncbi:hypothetical protein EON66_09640 [archaeon]|nr:MAG: hypothetical protein EON66_09640 [archaeon]
MQAYRKYDALTAKHIEALRKHTKAIQDSRLANNNDGMKAALKLYDEALERWALSPARLTLECTSVGAHAHVHARAHA